MKTAEAAATRAAGDASSIAIACGAMRKKEMPASTKENKVNKHISDGRKSDSAVPGRGVGSRRDGRTSAENEQNTRF